MAWCRPVRRDDRGGPRLLRGADGPANRTISAIMLTSTANTTLLHNITIGLSPSNDTPWLLCDFLVNNTVWHEAHSVLHSGGKKFACQGGGTATTTPTAAVVRRAYLLHKLVWLVPVIAMAIRAID